jgi:phytanoyl-CoA hydroxylase
LFDAYTTDAFDATSTLTKPKHRAINKIGHYLHELSPSFRAISLSARNAAIARSLGFQDPRVLQSMVICKQPEIGGAVPPHQDSTFLYTDPPSAVGWWYALEDATAENGCLSFAAGSHKRAAIEKRFVRTGKGTGFIDNEGAKFPKGLKTEVNGGEKEDYEVVEKEERYNMGEVKAGTLVLIHGNILHKSEKNTSEKSRNIYTFHVIEGEERYDERNWLQPPEKGFSRLLQAEKTTTNGAHGDTSNRLAKDW